MDGMRDLISDSIGRDIYQNENEGVCERKCLLQNPLTAKTEREKKSLLLREFNSRAKHVCIVIRNTSH